MPPSQTVVRGDCLDVFGDFSNYFEAIVTDPPAGIGFMGRAWDKLPVADRKKALAREDAFSDYWAERFDVARHACVEDAVMLAWALPRTVDLTMRAVRLGGWQIQDVIVHVFGQGWPKDKQALKPAQEMWILARKGKPTLGIDACRVERGEKLVRPPIQRDDNLVLGKGLGLGRQDEPQGSWPTNFVLSHCEGCEPAGVRRVKGSAPASGPTLTGASSSFARGGFNGVEGTPSYAGEDGKETVEAWRCVVRCASCGNAWLADAGGAAPTCACGAPGSWACPVAELDAQSGNRPGMKSGGIHRRENQGGMFGKIDCTTSAFADRGGASRFFPSFGYYAKANGQTDKKTGVPMGERHLGCEDLFWRANDRHPFGFERVDQGTWEALDAKERARGNVHPTVKSIAMVRWLHALTGAKKIGDLSAGSCTGSIAAYLDGVEWYGAEVMPEAIEIGKARLAWWKSLSPEELLAITKKRVKVGPMPAMIGK